MDVRTVVLVGAMLAGALAIILALALPRYTSALRDSMRLWLCGLAVLPVGQLLLGLRGEIPDLLSIVVANTFLVSAFVAFTLAVRSYVGQRTSAFSLLAPLVVVPVATFLFSAEWPNFTARVVLVSLSMLWLLGILLLSLRHAFHRGGPTGQQVVAVTFGIAAVSLLVRMLAQLLASDSDGGILNADLANVTTLAYMTIAPLLATVGFMLMSNERLMAEAIRLSTVDALTGAYSRRALNDLCERVLAEARRHRRPLSVLMIDADHFKNINDTYGHDAGDEVLIELVRRIRITLRAEDFVGRIGGEEFVAVLPDTPEEEARQVSERLRVAIARDTFIHDGEEIPFTISIGVAERDPGEAAFEALLKRADDAMYAAKRGGRNRVAVASDLATASVA